MISDTFCAFIIVCLILAWATGDMDRNSKAHRTDYHQCRVDGRPKYECKGLTGVNERDITEFNLEPSK